MGIGAFLSRLLFGEPPKRAKHSVLGEMILYRASLGDYWEAELTRDGRKIGIFVDSVDGHEPTAAQITFVQRYVDDPGIAFRMAEPMLRREYERWTRKAFPADWREAFSLSGLTVPLDGDERKPWDVSFDCLADAEHMFTCEFEGGKPVAVTVDG